MASFDILSTYRPGHYSEVRYTMTHFRDMIRRHYEFLEREHAKLSEEEAARTRVEAQNALYLADLVSPGMTTQELLALVRGFKLN